MQAAGRNHKQVFNEINITPLTDIFLVLLIIMMVVAPMMQQVRQDIKPPNLHTGSAIEPNKLTVEVSEKGVFYVQGQETTPEALTATLKEQEDLLRSKDKDAGKTVVSDESSSSTAPVAEKLLVIRADKATKSGQVLKVFEAARDAGFTKVTVAGEPLSEERQDALKQQEPQQQNTGGNP
jgi:biopolymer transport protein ExbD